MARRRLDRFGVGVAPLPKEFAQSPMPALPTARPVAHEFAAIAGRVLPLRVSGVAPNLIVQDTPLISARVNGPRQWCVTLMQILKGPNGTSPWQLGGTASEGGIVYPGTVNTTPQVPDPSQALQCALRWGAGGASFVARFDYPVMGSVFGVTADTLDLNVALRTAAAGTPYASLDVVPTVGAFMTEGRAADATPLQWCEDTAAVLGPASLYWTVKPYARVVIVHIRNGNAVDAITFLDAAGGGLYTFIPGGGNLIVTLRVPAQAVALQYSVAAGTPNVTPMWQIGLV